MHACGVRLAPLPRSPPMAASCADNGPRRAQPTGAPYALMHARGIPFSGLLRREFRQPACAGMLSVSGVPSLCGLKLLTCLRHGIWVDSTDFYYRQT